MRQDCTELFLRFREIARVVWNLGFWPNPDLREWDSIGVYEEAMARLFEGMILMPLGFQGRIENKFRPGEIGNFTVTTNSPGVKLLVDRNLPMNPGHVWGDPVVRLNSQPYALRFVNFFDWEQLAPRDFRLLEVLIDRLDDERSDLAGHHAIVELEKCSIWFTRDDDQENPNKPGGNEICKTNSVNAS